MVRLFRYLPAYSPDWGWVLAETLASAIRLVQDDLAADDDDSEPTQVRLVEYELAPMVLPAEWSDEVSQRQDQPAGPPVKMAAHLREIAKIGGRDTAKKFGGWATKYRSGQDE